MGNPSSSEPRLKLTPFDIQTKTFSSKMMGYNPNEVRDYLKHLAKKWEEMQRHTQDQSDKIANLEGQLIQWRGKEAELLKQREKLQEEARHLRQHHEKISQEMIENARSKSTAIRLELEKWLEETLSHFGECLLQYEAFKHEFEGLVEDQRQSLKKSQNSTDDIALKLKSLMESLEKGPPTTMIPREARPGAPNFAPSPAPH